MGRAHILPDWFGRLHGKHKTPTNALNFVMLIVLIAPFFGREVLSWVVDMSSIGTIIGYLFASLAAYSIAGTCRDMFSASTRPLAVLGCIASLICLCLLVLPFSPAAISFPSWCVLGIWVALGFCLYCLRLNTIRSYPEDERAYLILGDSELCKSCVPNWKDK